MGVVAPARFPAVPGAVAQRFEHGMPRIEHVGAAVYPAVSRG